MDKEKEQETTQPKEETQSTSQGTGDTQPTSTEATTLTPTVNQQRVDDNFIQPEQDSVDCFLRHNTKKIRKFWYVLDSKNNRLRDIQETKLAYEHDLIEILFNAPELRRFFPTMFEIGLDTGKMCTFTDPRVGCEPDPFNLGGTRKPIQRANQDNRCHISHGKNTSNRKNHSSHKDNATQRIQK